MPDSFTFTRLSEIYAETEDRSEASKQRFHRQLRHLQTIGFIEKRHERDARGTAQFDLYNAAKGRVGVVLLNLGLDVKALLESDSALNKPYFGASPAPGARRAGSLGAALQGVAAGQEWSLHLALLRSVTTGESRLVGHCRPDAESEDPKAKQITADYRRLVRGEVEEAVVTIPLNPLLAPLLQA